MHQDEKQTMEEVKMTGQLAWNGIGGWAQTCCGTWLPGVGAEASSFANPQKLQKNKFLLHVK